MVKGFEKETAPLTEQEKELAKYIAKGMVNRVGKEKALSNPELQKILKDRLSIEVSDSRIRKIFNYLRRSGNLPLLCSSSKGYYLARNLEELAETIESLENRINAMKATKEELERQYFNFQKLNNSITENAA